MTPRESADTRLRLHYPCYPLFTKVITQIVPSNMLDYLTLDVIYTRPLVVLVTLIGGGALVAGSFSFLLPTTALQVYGISPARTPINYEPIARSLSIRNITLGLSMLVITDYWQHIVEDDPVAGHIVQRCLGYMIMIGSVAPAADAYGAWKDGSESLRRPTTVLHCFRLCAWLTGGIWCLNT